MNLDFKKAFTLIAVLVSCYAYSPSPLAAGNLADSIVKIYCVRNRPNYYIPWNMNGPKSVSGSGCVISHNRILTNAHVVSDSTFIQIRLPGHPKRLTAHLVAVSHEADLALLELDDPAHLKSIQPLTIGKLPRVQQEVFVYGFPLGGETLSTTKGVVSRIEHQTYAHSSTDLLAIQIDAAINPGNSGGPAMVDGQIVGVVMQSIGKAENIGYIVPTPIIEHFLDDLKDGKYDGFPSMGLKTQTLENESFKRMLGLTSDQTGILVISILPGYQSAAILKPGDVILSIDGHRIEDDGTVEFRSKERTKASFFIQAHQIGENAELMVFRNREKIHLTVVLNHSSHYGALVKNEQYDIRPSYYIYGGLVFSPLTKDYIKTWGRDWGKNAPVHLLNLLYYGRPQKVNQQAVLLVRVLADEINNGYHDLSDLHIVSVNGHPFTDLAQMIHLIESLQDPFVELKDQYGYSIVLDRKAVLARNQNILKTYNVIADRSKDLNF